MDRSKSCSRCGSPDAGQTEECHRCRRWGRELVEVRSAFAFSGPIRRAIHLSKYNGQFARLDWFSEQMAAVISETGWEIDFLTAVPLTEARQRSRGYNQAARIAEPLARLSNHGYRDVVLKVRDTRPQTGLRSADRFRNVAGAFEAQGVVPGHNVVLVDDVVTTGATLLACARALKSAGAGQVYGLTVATRVADDPA